MAGIIVGFKTHPPASLDTAMSACLPPAMRDPSVWDYTSEQGHYSSSNNLTGDVEKLASNYIIL